MTGSQCGFTTGALKFLCTLVWLPVARFSVNQLELPVALCAAPSVSGSPRVGSQLEISDLIKALLARQAAAAVQ